MESAALTAKLPPRLLRHSAPAVLPSPKASNGGQDSPDELRRRVWKQWRSAPGFNQHFTGNLSADGRVITATWEQSPDGVNWEHDFDLTSTKAE